LPTGARLVDLGDATILQGFIDPHVHVTDESSDDWNADMVAGLRRTIPEQTLRAAEFARRTLMAAPGMSGAARGRRTASETILPRDREIKQERHRHQDARVQASRERFRRVGGRLRAGRL